ncbi:myb-related protein 306 isoform X1 [Iris pallida]|uniref:Myb-related protein 306 isoform X1 n=1 Tax=Iris pallida TaxID=29817 RepID=A0AAX6F395_IRIPA|nr:myb-related protein 306 isoform X1 [Iris pallida]
MYVDAWSPSQYAFTLDVLKVPQGSGSVLDSCGTRTTTLSPIIMSYEALPISGNSIKIYRRNAKRTREHSTDKHCTLRLAQITGSQNLQNFIVKGQ